MENPRKYGKAPFSVAVIHGGPGAGGEMAPVARELASGRGVLEPLQRATSLDGQVQELKTALEKNGDLPVTLIGFSWGAWLSYLVAAHYPSLVRKLILVGSGPFEQAYVPRLLETRLERLSEEEREEFKSTLEILGDPAAKDKSASLARLGALCSKTDTLHLAMMGNEAEGGGIDFRVHNHPPQSPILGITNHPPDAYTISVVKRHRPVRSINYDPVEHETNESSITNRGGDIFHGVWKDAAELRRSGKLLELARHVRCPVVAIHGDYDPHPAAGVQEPLSATLTSFRFILLKNCGHTPWIEREARARFYEIIEEELR